MREDRFTGQVALVTGAASGLGRATAAGWRATARGCCCSTATPPGWPRPPRSAPAPSRHRRRHLGRRSRRRGPRRGRARPGLAAGRRRRHARPGQTGRGRDGSRVGPAVRRQRQGILADRAGTAAGDARGRRRRHGALRLDRRDRRLRHPARLFRQQGRRGDADEEPGAEPTPPRASGSTASAPARSRRRCWRRPSPPPGIGNTPWPCYVVLRFRSYCSRTTSWSWPTPTPRSSSARATSRSVITTTPAALRALTPGRPARSIIYIRDDGRHESVPRRRHRPADPEAGRGGPHRRAPDPRPRARPRRRAGGAADEVASSGRGSNRSATSTCSSSRAGGSELIGRRLPLSPLRCCWCTLTTPYCCAPSEGVRTGRR